MLRKILHYDRTKREFVFGKLGTNRAKIGEMVKKSIYEENTMENRKKGNLKYSSEFAKSKCNFFL